MSCGSISQALDTGIGLRNEHLRSTYLELDRGPEFRDAVLSDIVLDEPPAGAERHETRFSGTLTLHGVQRTVEGEAELRRRNGRIQVEADLSLSLDAFDIPPPRYLGIGVRDRIDITGRVRRREPGVARGRRPHDRHPRGPRATGHGVPSDSPS